MLLVIKKDMKKIKEIKDVFYLKTICDLKKIKSKENYILLYDITIDEFGIILEYNYFLDEVLLSIPIKKVITNIDSDKLKEICKFHDVDVIYR